MSLFLRKILYNISERLGKALIWVVILLLLFSIGTLCWGIRQRAERQRTEHNLNQHTTEWRSERGQLVNESTELRYTVRELRRITRQDSTELSTTQKQLFEARQIIDNLRVGLRKTQAVHMIDVESRSSDTTRILIGDVLIDDITTPRIEIEPIKTEFLELTFEHIDGDSLVVDHLYRNHIDIVIDRDYGLSDLGRERFLLFRWVWPRWEYSSNVVSDDPNARITTNVYINFQRGRGRRD